MAASDPVDWALAARVAGRVADRSPASADWSGIVGDFARLVPLAETLVETETGLRSLAGPATTVVVDRKQWVEVNLAAFRGLLEPLFERFAERIERGGRVGAAQLAVTRRMAAVELGLLLGWMSGRVLGQYDLLVTEESGDQDTVYVVGPNLAAIEQRFGFDPQQFRLWVALHEVTHRAQFTGVSWMREHYLALVREVLTIADPDPVATLASIRDALRSPSMVRLRLQEGGIAALLASPAQREALGRIAGLMALLEGHGDVTMDRAGAERLPDAERFGRVLRERRRQANPFARLIQRLAGIEAKLLQYEAGERFIAAIEAAGGRRSVDRCWVAADRLPTIEEIREPQRWLDRQIADAVA